MRIPIRIPIKGRGFVFMRGLHRLCALQGIPILKNLPIFKGFLSATQEVLGFDVNSVIHRVTILIT